MAVVAPARSGGVVVVAALVLAVDGWREAEQYRPSRGRCGGSASHVRQPVARHLPQDILRWCPAMWFKGQSMSLVPPPRREAPPEEATPRWFEVKASAKFVGFEKRGGCGSVK